MVVNTNNVIVNRRDSFKYLTTRTNAWNTGQSRGTLLGPGNPFLLGHRRIPGESLCCRSPGSSQETSAMSFHQQLEKYFDINCCNLISTDQVIVTVAINILDHTLEFLFSDFFSVYHHIIKMFGSLRMKTLLSCSLLHLQCAGKVFIKDSHLFLDRNFFSGNVSKNCYNVHSLHSCMIESISFGYISE